MNSKQKQEIIQLKQELEEIHDKRNEAVQDLEAKNKQLVEELQIQKQQAKEELKGIKDKAEENNKVLISAKNELMGRIDELIQEVEKQKGEAEFFKGIVNAQPKETEPQTPKSKPEDLDKIKQLGWEIEELKAKIQEYESKIEQLDQDNEFLRKLLKDKEEVSNLKARYSYVGSLLQTVKDPNQADQELIRYTERLMSQGKSLFDKDEDMQLLPDDDVLTLNRISSRQNFNDTFKMSRTNTNVESVLHRRVSEDSEIGLVRAKSNIETADFKRTKVKKSSELEKKVKELQEQIDTLTSQNNDLQEQIEFRNRYISQLEEGKGL